VVSATIRLANERVWVIIQDNEVKGLVKKWHKHTVQVLVQYSDSLQTFDSKAR
jgi:hypothetical protein